MSDTLAKLADVLEERKRASAATSYVASLYAKGTEHILKKIGEEASELLVAGAKGGDAAELVHETADLWFHTLVLLAHRGVRADAVLGELDRRMGRSGLEEKSVRPAAVDP
jgi:phosphoribosyl-ATP pyrophosphohydrolase